MINLINHEKNKLAYDKACKKIISNKTLLAYIFKNFIDEYKDLNLLEIVSLLQVNKYDELEYLYGIQNEDIYLKEGSIQFDFLTMAKLPDHQNYIMVNIEMQLDDHPGYPIVNRALYYTSRLVSSQKNIIFKNSDYGKIIKVISLWICPSVKSSKTNAINKYKTSEHRILGNYTKESLYYDKMEIIIIRLKELEEDLCKPLNILFNSIGSIKDKIKVLKENYGINLYEEEEEVEVMCNLSELWIRRAELMIQENIEQGRMQGIQQGLQEGAVQGEKQMLKDIVSNLMNTSKLSLEEVMNLLCLDEEKRNYCKVIFS